MSMPTVATCMRRFTASPASRPAGGSGLELPLHGTGGGLRRRAARIKDSGTRPLRNLRGWRPRRKTARTFLIPFHRKRAALRRPSMSFGSQWPGAETPRKAAIRPRAASTPSPPMSITRSEISLDIGSPSFLFVDVNPNVSDLWANTRATIVLLFFCYPIRITILADMIALLHQAMSAGNLGEGQDCLDDRRNFPPSSRGQTFSASPSRIACFSAAVRGRSNEPIICRRFHENWRNVGRPPPGRCRGRR